MEASLTFPHKKDHWTDKEAAMLYTGKLLYAELYDRRDSY